MHRKSETKLLAALKEALPELKKLAEQTDSEWYGEDYIYRYYHHSFKAYRIQDETLRIVKALSKLGEITNKDFLSILQNGIGKKFQLEHNRYWNNHVQPMLLAYQQARYFLAMAIKYGEELTEVPSMLPTGWAAFLYLYDMR